MSNQENKRGNPSKTQSSNPPSSTSNDPSQPNPAPSLASRIQTSATSLAKSAFNPSSDIANTLASTTSSKAGPSSLPNTQTSRDLSTTTHGTPGSASTSTSTSTAQPFREHDTSSGFALPALTEDEFQNGNSYGYDGIDETTTTTATTTTTNTYQSEHQTHQEDLQTPSSTWKGKARAHDPTQHQLETVWQRQWHNETKKHTPTDGAAVVSLLSDSNFDPNFEDPTTVPDTEIDIAAMPIPLSAGEREALDSFRKGMGLEEKREGRLTGASLVPDIDVFLSQGLGEGSTVTGGSTSTSLRDAVLMNLPGAGDWVGVQERYHDEVWGFLQPVLEEARVEIEKGREEGVAGEDGPAVRRLKMILMHMKG
ncbi:hypothetical protein N7491_009817 [Penicillium cf. griseofulvum]|uniref:Uncharacterized protein n=1 Tax=Penicillium cf. griseofulvum TaxID=2972120 RepID=A0A9W9T5G4_9EURO|nr:hypothetical protein N7472_000145 [Penicillium cf. griseofulvum]KAJ5421372.1 hypothetical protein N7491_009817 [Penicillium cf. griseofulvum]KAJ5424607.1 hypothetical protein N7445_010580 [Penicillium cf. griseofulvum]